MDRSHLKGVESPTLTNGLDSSRLRPAVGAVAAVSGRPEPPIATEALVDLEKIRDILFGVERRESDRRFADLEQRLEAQSVQSELEIQRRMEAFEEQIKKELRAIGAEISSAQQQSAARVEAVAEGLQAAMAQVQSQMEELSTRTGTSEQDLREQLAQQSASLSDSIRLSFEELSAAMENKTQELRAETVDWSGFSTILGNLANQVAAKRPS